MKPCPRHPYDPVTPIGCLACKGARLGEADRRKITKRPLVKWKADYVPIPAIFRIESRSFVDTIDPSFFAR